MCTVTWRFTPDIGGWALDLGFNRDERRDRPRAHPPRVRRPAAGLAFIAPRDQAGGGSWLALNTAGLRLGLLNLYKAEAGAPAMDDSFKFKRKQVIAGEVTQGVHQTVLSWTTPQPRPDCRQSLLNGAPRH